MRNPYVANCNFKVETRSQKGVPRREFTSVGGSCKRERVSPLDSIFVFLSPFSIRSPSNPVCASLAGSLLQTGSWGDTASRKHPTGAFSFANLSEYASVRSRRRRTVGIQPSGRERGFCARARASPIVGAEWLAQFDFTVTECRAGAVCGFECYQM